MTKNGMELVFILDRSGSMQGLESDTIVGFNSMLEQQKKKPGKARVSTILFDDRIEVLHNRVKLEEAKPITSKEYYVRGRTALLDAIGSAICYIGKCHASIPSEKLPKHTLFVIITDGMENSSHCYSAQQIKKMIQHRKEKYRWEFLFLGANIDAVETAGQIGITPDRAVNYHCDGAGVRLNYETVDQAVSAIRCDTLLNAHWKDAIEKDFRWQKTRAVHQK